MVQLKQNTLLAGAIWGLLIPFVGVAILMMIDESILSMDLALPNNQVYTGQKPRTIYLLGICLNLIPFQIYRNRRMDKSLRGVGLVTMVYAIIWFFIFASSLI
ncbi:MAG: hypothetical protein AB8G11_00700 [Saprospiraceae bacterium]